MNFKLIYTFFFFFFFFLQNLYILAIIIPKFQMYKLQNFIYMDLVVIILNYLNLINIYIQLFNAII
jgi:hypothetical protein